MYDHDIDRALERHQAALEADYQNQVDESYRRGERVEKLKEEIEAEVFGGDMEDLLADFFDDLDVDDFTGPEYSKLTDAIRGLHNHDGRPHALLVASIGSHVLSALKRYADKWIQREAERREAEEHGMAEK